MPQRLEKLQILNQDNSNNSFEVLFNPTEYTVEEGSNWQEQKKPRYKSELQYTGWKRKSISMELFFDTYEKNEDVRRTTDKFAKLLIPTINRGEQGKRPPKIRLRWGPADPDATSGIFSADWVLEKLTQKFTLFTGAGMPVRATVNVTFKEFIPPRQVNKNNPRPNSFPDKIYTIKAGDTLSSITAQLWNDPKKWRIIAEKNEIVNPRILEVGQTLIVPAIK